MMNAGLADEIGQNGREPIVNIYICYLGELVELFVGLVGVLCFRNSFPCLIGLEAY
jgi:hypothetical protein